MSAEPSSGREPPAELAFRANEPAGASHAVAAPRDGASLQPRRPPVARRALPEAQVRVAPDPDRPPLRFPWTLRNGLIASLAVHLALLVILAVWTIAHRTSGIRAFEARFGGGSPLGSDLGDQLTGGLGMDEPLALSAAFSGPVLETNPALTLSTPLSPDALERVLGGAESPQGTGGITTIGSGQAGSGDGFGVARFGTGTERIHGIDVKIGDPQFTLIWDGRADLDLHVQEPGGSHIFWPDENRKGAQGGELDVDNRTGPGPENVFWVTGKGPPGTYRWFVEYYSPPPFEEYTGPVRWRVRVKHGGKTTEYRGTLKDLKDRSRVYTLTLDEKDRSS